MADSETELCKGYDAEGTRTGKISMTMDYGTKVKHLSQHLRCEPNGMPEALIITKKKLN